MMKTFKQYLNEDTVAPPIQPPGPPNPPGSMSPTGFDNPNLPQHPKFNPNGYTPSINPRRAYPRNPTRQPYRGNRVDTDEFDDFVGFDDIIPFIAPGLDPYIMPFQGTETAPEGPGGPTVIYPAPWSPEGWTNNPNDAPPGWWFNYETEKWNYRPNPAESGKDPDAREYDYYWDPVRHRWFPNTNTINEPEPWYTAPRQREQIRREME